MYLFFDHETGDLYPGRAVFPFNYLEWEPGRESIGNYFSIGAAAEAWPNDTIRVINFSLPTPVQSETDPNPYDESVL